MADPYSNDPWAVDNIGDNRREDPRDTAHGWADADEAQTHTPNTPPKKETSNVSNGTEGKVVTTIKYGAGFDAPWTVIHSDSVEDAKNTLNEAKDLLELTAKVAKYAKTLDSGPAPAGQRSNGNGGGQRQQQPTPPGVASKSCAHGEMVYRTGNSQKGPWQAYFCSLDKGDPNACKPVWVK
ncbi:hypothetical protein [Nonomuraea sp. NPDC049129]|uniref:hypothetical protein n=1 Tax=Nonomuraea sp. NPDC049129 TaxID=3155272 RepID=UPI0033CFFA0E